jgi:hypothetical protein
VNLACVRRFKAFLFAKFYELTRDQRLLANALAALGKSMETAGEKHRVRVGIAHSILGGIQLPR